MTCHRPQILLLMASILIMGLTEASSSVLPPWPRPSSYSQGDQTIYLASSSSFVLMDASLVPTDTIRHALARYRALIFSHETHLPSEEASTLDTDMSSSSSRFYLRHRHDYPRGRELPASSFPPFSHTLPPFGQKEDERRSLAPMLAGLKVYVEGPDELPPQLETDESYVLEIPAAASATTAFQKEAEGEGEENSVSSSSILVATLRAPTIYGALRGLESFTQLVLYDWLALQAADEEEAIQPSRSSSNSSSSNSVIKGASRFASSLSSSYYIVKGVPWSISDQPRFGWRGLLIDTGRHFLPIPHIKNLLDAMSYAKLNVLHWHLVDTPAFPFQSHRYPHLWQSAFSSPAERYLQAEVIEIVEYARQRGIRVVPEFDVPGHAASWCQGYPSICPSTSCLEPLDPSNEETFDLITGLLEEVATEGGGGKGEERQAVFPDAFFHLGGDEVNSTCWNQTDHIHQWLQEKDFTLNDAYKYFVDRAAQIALGVNRQPVQWVEVFEQFGNRLDKQTVVQIWKEKSTLRPVLEAGYRALLSDYDVWYLDHLNVTWNQVYMNEPYEGIDDEDQRALILGGEAGMWGETVDASDLENTIWPRAAAFAERLWSPITLPSGEEPDLSEVQVRLEHFRCLLLRRGIQAAPVTATQARQAPEGPGSCYQ